MKTTGTFAGGKFRWALGGAMALLAVGPLNAQTDLPDGPGKEIVMRACTACHGVERIVSAKKVLSQWQQTVERMMNHGAELSTDEMDVVVSYLYKNYPQKEEAK